MRRVLQQSAHTGNPSLRKPSPCILSCRRLSHCRAARQAPCDSEAGEPGHPSRSDAIRILIGMGLFAAYEERKQAGRKEG